MRIGGLFGTVLICMGLAACSTQDLAERRTKGAQLTPYNEAYNVWGTPIVRDDRVDANSIEIEVTGLSLMSAQRAAKLARFHAAIVGRQDGRSHFALGDGNVKIVCSSSGSRTQLDVVATYGLPEALVGKAYKVDAVIAELENEMRNPQTTHQDRQRIFLANQMSCSSKRLIAPESVNLGS
ncbi:MAG: hypothetical protein HEP70_09105 [Rhodobiaceae bacterium]|nr:hypothetical protein [Rhodobiaceae bacterium]